LSTALPPAVDLCNPSPCGPNSQCHDGVCTCLPEYQGDPYAGCRPECVLSTDCPRNRACIRNKCADPCPGTCGQGALCDVLNHIPSCSCPEGFTGDPFILCRAVPCKKSSSGFKHQHTKIVVTDVLNKIIGLMLVSSIIIEM